jgi:hypothetical protein
MTTVEALVQGYYGRSDLLQRIEARLRTGSGAGRQKDTALNPLPAILRSSRGGRASRGRVTGCLPG